MAERASPGLPRGPARRFYKMGAAAALTGVEPHVLRYWENEFPPLRPGKTRGGQRLYSDDDIELILRIKELLYEQGFTIAGARRRLRAERAAGSAAGERRLLEALRRVRQEIRAILTLMEGNDRD